MWLAAERAAVAEPGEAVVQTASVARMPPGKSRSLASARTAIRIIFGVPQSKTNFFLLKLRDLGVALGFGLALVLSAALSVAGSAATGVGHPPQTLSDVRSPDARRRKIDRPDGVTARLQVKRYKVEPHEAVRARNLFPKAHVRAATTWQLQQQPFFLVCLRIWRADSRRTRSSQSFRP